MHDTVEINWREALRQLMVAIKKEGCHIVTEQGRAAFNQAETLLRAYAIARDLG